jgi:hypothetical protein
MPPEPPAPWHCDSPGRPATKYYISCSYSPIAARNSSLLLQLCNSSGCLEFILPARHATLQPARRMACPLPLPATPNCQPLLPNPKYFRPASYRLACSTANCLPTEAYACYSRFPGKAQPAAAPCCMSPRPPLPATRARPLPTPSTYDSQDTRQRPTSCPYRSPPAASCSFWPGRDACTGRNFSSTRKQAPVV